MRFTQQFNRRQRIATIQNENSALHAFTAEPERCVCSRQGRRGLAIAYAHCETAWSILATKSYARLGITTM
jgi:hypothetical protein